jgi:hypothetical protein
MKRHWRYGMALATTLALVPLLAWAEGGGTRSGGSSGSKSAGKGGTASSVITVLDVDLAENSITVGGGTTPPTKYTVTNLTKIMINGRPGTLAQIEKGMKADVTAGVSGTTASRIEVETYTGTAASGGKGKTSTKAKGGD